MPTINDLRQQAAIIKNATQVGENTATRVGTTFETIADLLEGMGGVTNLSTIDIGSIDTLNTTGDMLVGTPNIYTLTKTIGANTFKVGTLFQFANNGRYDVAQVIVSQFIVDADGRIDTTSADQEVHIFYRLCKTMNGGSLPTPIGTWSTWTELGGSDGSGVTIDPYPTQDSGNAVSSGGVFERLQDVAPKVDISAIDDIDEYSDMLATKSPFYVVTKTLSGNVFRIGTLMEFSNQGRYILYQILATDYVLNDDGTLDTTLSENGGLKLIWRMKQFSGNPPAGVTIGVWSAWAKFGDSGYQPDNEDIDLNANDQLQFANKAYDASAFSGLGRVYLRKNIVQLNLTDKYFDGFVNDVLVQDVGTSSTPDAILFDTTRKMFVARVGLLYYVDWSSDEDYNPITRDVNWNYNDNFYRWNGEELVQWDKTINQLTQAMMNTANTIYHIQYDYDLNGQTITLPAGCVLKFNGGSIGNGNISFNRTYISGIPSFKNCQYSGSIVIDYLNDNQFTSADDKTTLAFLIGNAIDNGCKLDINREYTLDMDGQHLVSKNGLLSGAVLNFNGHTITNTFQFQGGDDEIYHKALIYLRNCSKVSIYDLNFRDSEPRSQMPGKSRGYNILQTTGDCSHINLIDCSQVNGDSPIRAGVYNYSATETGRIGLNNSIIKVRATEVGYGSVIYLGQNLNITIVSKDTGRGAFFSALEKSRIFLNSENPQITGVNLLLSDGLFTSFDKNGNAVKAVRGCSDLDISIIIPELKRSTESAIIFSSNGTNDDFSQRISRCKHSNIRASVLAESFASSVERTYLTRIDDYAQDVENLIINGFSFGGGSIGDYLFTSPKDCNISMTFLNGRSLNNGTFYFIATGKAEGVVNVSNTPLGEVKGSSPFSGNLTIVCDKTSQPLTYNHSAGIINVVCRDPYGVTGGAVSYNVKHYDYLPGYITTTISTYLNDLNKAISAATGTRKTVIIRHAVNLNGGSINLSDYRVIFEGGKLSNGTIYANAGTRFIGSIELDGVIIAGNTNQNYGDTRPTASIIGQTFFDTSIGKMIVWNGTAWVNMDGTNLT